MIWSCDEVPLSWVFEVWRGVWGSIGMHSSASATLYQKWNCSPDLRCKAVEAHAVEGNMLPQPPNWESGPWVTVALVG